MTRRESAALLEVVGLRAGYGQAQVLHDVDLEVRDGETVVLLGANGAGKSTLLKALSGITGRTGLIGFAGADISRLASADIVRRGLGQVPEGRGTFSDLTVEENLRLGAYPTSLVKAQVHADIAEMAALFPVLGERSLQRAGLLSGGEQQMLAIARALMGRPRLLLLDEPSLGLAPTITARVFDSLAELNRSRGISLLIVEQNAQISLGIADYAYVLEAGSIRVHGPAATIRDDASLRHAYLGY